MSEELQVRCPQTDEEWQQYYHLRWSVLRQPWGEPEGSERDEQDGETEHCAVVADGRVIGVGRLQMNSHEEAQIRYMAVAPDCHGRGLGRRVVEFLEEKARELGAARLVLDARQNAVGFYLILGYNVTADSYLLFGKIQHYRMQKDLY
ncbi:MAG: GNAT family N-acetyltransferase [Candidatus Riflebacteria bacterium HGW-Riflebacteria-2]|jgi:predicted GNAT family N-acyltransferase|nr:MAG: GNAT family N-acetyltransferase [Candidatus Riflebacteria bacterium HGW-Riflebacteria-2]